MGREGGRERERENKGEIEILEWGMYVCKLTN